MSSRARRLETVLRVRELVEQQRMAEAATASRRLADTVQRRVELEADHAGTVASGGRYTAAGMASLRLGALALRDAVDRARDEEATARRAAADAAGRRVDAAVERRSVERAHERSSAEAARAAARRTERRLDEVALERWRRG